MSRLFRSELGTSFVQWRQQVLLARAVPLAARKLPMASDRRRARLCQPERVRGDGAALGRRAAEPLPRRRRRPHRLERRRSVRRLRQRCRTRGSQSVAWRWPGTRRALDDRAGVHLQGATMRCSRRPLLALAAFGCALGPRLAWSIDRLARIGVAVTERRDVGTFSAIVARRRPSRSLLKPAPRESIEIVADDNVLPLIETRVARPRRTARALEIEWPPHARIDPRTPVVRHRRLRSPRRRSRSAARVASAAAHCARTSSTASIGGSGTVSLTGIDAREVAVTIGGSGRFDGEGRAAQARAGDRRQRPLRRRAADRRRRLGQPRRQRRCARPRRDARCSASIVGSGVLFLRGRGAADALARSAAAGCSRI